MNDKSKLIANVDELGDDDHQSRKEDGNPRNYNRYESTRSNTSTFSQQPLKLSGLSYAFSSSTLPNNSSGEGIN